MENKKKLIAFCAILFGVVLLGTGTIAYFRRSVNGAITGNAGNLVLIVNDADAVLNETFNVSLNSAEMPYIYPGDSGTFDLNIVSTGSSADVTATITILRTDLPDNLKFYLDEDYTNELTTAKFVLEKADVMEKTVPVYWYWDGTKDDDNDSLYIEKTLEATVSVTASMAKPFINTLLANATLDTNVDFAKMSTVSNGQGLMLMSSTQNDQYPIVYYRGDVNDNVVKVGGFCWLIVRTTETGGIKLIYNGEINDDGSCNNYSGVGGVTANSNYTDLYINNNTYKFINESIGYGLIFNGYMYNNDTNFYDDNNNLDVDGFKAFLANETIDNSTGRLIQNKYDSNIKTVIDSWYEENILGMPLAGLLEDTVWCNDRSVTSDTYSFENLSSTNSLYYSSTTRLRESSNVNPSLLCANYGDKFTVSREIGNGDLKYPISTITADELAFAGNNVDDYSNITFLSIANRKSYWTITPDMFVKSGNNAYIYVTYGYRIDSYNSMFSYYGVRPMISLANTVEKISGNGTYENPYVLG